MTYIALDQERLVVKRTGAAGPAFEGLAAEVPKGAFGIIVQAPESPPSTVEQPKD